MSNQWSLTTILESLHDDISNKLEIARKSMGHPVAKGDSSEKIWIELFQEYLPKRYSAEKAFVVDSKGQFSQQLDVVVFDRQYSPFIFKYKDQFVIPAESVYAVFEAKQSVTADMIGYAQEKVNSVRQLHRTSLPIPHAGGTYAPKEPIKIIGGILSFESDWSPPMGQPLETALDKDKGCLTIGCVASHGHFLFEEISGTYQIFKESKPATAFLLHLIALLQFAGTVPMIDVLAYLQWLNKPKP